MKTDIIEGSIIGNIYENDNKDNEVKNDGIRDGSKNDSTTN